MHIAAIARHLSLSTQTADKTKIGDFIQCCINLVNQLDLIAVEGQVANLSGSYTNALQLKARCDVLRERQDLKYAALDCWKIVAEQLPEGISLQRLSFSDGQKLSLSGTIAPGQINGLFDFNSSLQKASLNNQPVFKTEGGEPLVYHQNGNTVAWNFSLMLQHGEDAP